jgi:hypothetical protein
MASEASAKAEIKSEACIFTVFEEILLLCVGLF